MHVGVDGTCWANGRGYGRYTRELCRQMVARAPDWRFSFFVDERAAARFDLAGANVALVRVRQSASPTEAAGAAGNRSPVDMLRLSLAVARQRPDVFFSPSIYTYFPLPPFLPAVVTVHDAIAERYPELTLPTSRARLFWKAKVKLALAQSRGVLTVSDFAAREIAEVHGVARERIRVSSEAAAPAFRPTPDPAEIAAAARRAGLGDGSRWFVYLGGFNPHKHVDLLVRCHARLARSVRGGGEGAPHLLLVGTLDADPFHGDQAGIRRAVAEEGTGDLVVWTGYLSDDDLRPLLSGSLALVLPSECEGFGLPAVEAAACGAPVVATTNSPLPEILAGGGIFVEPGDEEALAAALDRMAGDEAQRAEMAERALARARALDWARSAEVALDALREAAGRRATARAVA